MRHPALVERIHSTQSGTRCANPFHVIQYTRHYLRPLSMSLGRRGLIGPRSLHSYYVTHRFRFEFEMEKTSTFSPFIHSSLLFNHL
jgi:hypothetical protein